MSECESCGAPAEFRADDGRILCGGCIDQDVEESETIQDLRGEITDLKAKLATAKRTQITMLAEFDRDVDTKTAAQVDQIKTQLTEERNEEVRRLNAAYASLESGALEVMRNQQKMIDSPGWYPNEQEKLSEVARKWLNRSRETPRPVVGR